MSYVETSAIVAILRREQGAGTLLSRMVDESCETSVVNVIEASLAIGKRIRDYVDAEQLVLDFLDKTNVAIVGVPHDISGEAVRAYARYGKGTGHPARLNFGDCISYVMAKRAGGPLIYKGEDFTHTDLA